MIRNHYWKTVEVGAKADNAYRQHLRRQKEKNLVPTESEKTSAKLAITEKYMFRIGWYPPCWLLWFCYGPPAGLGEPSLDKMQMEHLIQVTAAPTPLTLEEEIVQLGAQSKILRTINKDKGKETTMNGDDTNATNKTVTIVREERTTAPSKDELLNRAIYGKNVQLSLLQANGAKEDEIRAIREELFELLQKKVDLAMQAFNDVN